jgi:hypothetical protein
MNERELAQAEGAVQAAAEKCREGAALMRERGDDEPWSEGAAELDRIADDLDKTADELRLAREKLKREKPKADKPM